MHQPDWAKNYVKPSGVKQQYTVVRRPQKPMPTEYGRDYPILPPMGMEDDMGGRRPEMPMGRGSRTPLPPMQANYTGLGDDGKFQRNNPTEIVETPIGPQTLHERELEVTLPGGRRVVVPSNKLPQEFLRYLESYAGLPGKASGGPLDTIKPVTVQTPAPDMAALQSAANGTADTNGRIHSKDPLPKPVTTVTAPLPAISSAPDLTAAAPSSPPPKPVVPIQAPLPAAASAANLSAAAPPATPSQSQQDITAAADYFRDAMAGTGETANNVAQGQLSQYNMGAGSDLLATAQRISTDPTMSSGAARAAMGRATQGVEIGRGQLLGEIGAQDIARRDAAAASLYNLASGERAYGDAESTRMATDVANGMTWEAFAQKYPHSTQADYQAMVAAGSAPLDPNNRIRMLLDGSKTLEDGLNDNTLRNSIARELGVAPTDSAVDDEIRMRWGIESEPLANRVWNRLTQEGIIPDEYISNPEMKGDWDRFISDLFVDNPAAFDSDGNLVDVSNVTWPWDNPDKFYLYDDWNGNPIDYSQPQDPATRLDIAGNGETYTNAAGNPVTFADMTAAWQDLKPSKRDDYFKNGKFDLESFLKDSDFYHGTTDEGRITWDPDNDPSQQQLWEEFVPTFTPPAFPTEITQDPANAGLFDNGYQGLFGYYDQNGIFRFENSESGTLAQVWKEFSDKYGNGEMLSPTEFARHWGDGSKWMISPQGHVLNFDSAFQQEHGLSADNPELNGTTGGVTNGINSIELPSSWYVNNTTIDGMPNKAKSSSNLDIYISGFGNMDSILRYNDAIYTSSRDSGRPSRWRFDNRISLTTEARSFFESNIGRQFSVNGHTYIIRGISDGDVLKQDSVNGIGDRHADITYYADGIILEDLSTGKQHTEYFGAWASFTD